MTRSIMLIPLGNNVGLTVTTLGIIKAIEQQHLKLTIFQPILKNIVFDSDVNDFIHVVQKNNNINVVYSIHDIYYDDIHHTHKYSLLMDQIFEDYNQKILHTDLIIVNRIKSKNNSILINKINYDIAINLNIEIIFVSVINNNIFDLQEKISIIKNIYGVSRKINISGIIFNKVIEHDIIYKEFDSLLFFNNFGIPTKEINNIQLFIKYTGIKLLFSIPLNFSLIYIPVIDLCNFLQLDYINKKNIHKNIIQSISLIEKQHDYDYSFNNINYNALVIVSAVNKKFLCNLLQYSKLRNKISLLVITNFNLDYDYIKNFITQVKTTNLSVIFTSNHTLFFLSYLKYFNLYTVTSSIKHLIYAQNFILNYVNQKWIQSFKNSCKIKNYFFPIEFRYHIRNLAKKSLHKRILLPEGYEPRIIKAAVFCSNNSIADCILLGDKKIIFNIALKNNIQLGNNISIINPTHISKNYVNRLIQLRKHKGMNEFMALEHIKNDIVLGTLMLELGDVDGLVVGAVHTTADSIRPGLQLIKMASSYSLISSAFFMLLPDRTCIYADCAINADPDYKQLSEIAIQSAESAVLFGIKPKIAMISYSTGTSGIGKKVELVRQATLLVKEKRPNFIIDGPIQYDAAMALDVANIKAPDSIVAGNATVIIFPDLNTGNTTYKAVQRSANIMCIGPMLQGMRKPINDLSRGASVEDIIYTIALTVIQSNNTIISNI
ncbi:Phosphate acetyltransferase [Buchnera aphidicola (Eriosoma lanigerum)]|uniref:phosphate acetyltransferase n=1 Tax=Buchnera aphidicola TaxID=9 RepID=UPI003463BDFE